MNSTDLTALRADRSSLLTQTCTVTRPAVDANGISTGAYTTVASNVLCRVRWPGGGPARPVVNSSQQQMTASIPGQVSIAFGNAQDVRARDVVTIGSVKYTVGITHNEGPQNFGLVVDAQMQRVPA